MPTFLTVQACSHGGDSGPRESWYPNHTRWQVGKPTCFSSSACIPFAHISLQTDQVMPNSRGTDGGMTKFRQRVWMQGGLKLGPMVKWIDWTVLIWSLRSSLSISEDRWDYSIHSLIHSFIHSWNIYCLSLMQSTRLCQTLLGSFTCLKIHTHLNSTSRLSPCGSREKLWLTPLGSHGACGVRACGVRGRIPFPKSMGAATACCHGDARWL